MDIETKERKGENGGEVRQHRGGPAARVWVDDRPGSAETRGIAKRKPGPGRSGHFPVQQLDQAVLLVSTPFAVWEHACVVRLAFRGLVLEYWPVLPHLLLLPSPIHLVH